MLLSERVLRSIIREALIEEGFWSRITDPKKWKQFKKSIDHSARKHGIVGGEMGEGLDFSGYLRYVFSEKAYYSKLENAIKSYHKGKISEDEMFNVLSTVSVDALCEYLGVTIQQVTRNNMANIYFNVASQTSFRQLASSIKYFSSGGIDEVLRMKKPDLENSFNRIIPLIIKTCNA